MGNITYVVQQGVYDDKHIVLISNDKNAAFAAAHATHAKDPYEYVTVHEWTLDAPRNMTRNESANPVRVLEIEEKPYSYNEEEM